jgi:pyrimidine-specific ribonucleoside hydrolase
MKRTLGLAFSVSFLLSACLPPTPNYIQLADQEEPIHLVIDTDMGMDDVIAILYLLQHPGVEVEAITISGTGLADCAGGVLHAAHLITLADNRKIPIACGRERPLQGDRVFPGAFRSGANSFYGMEFDVIDVPQKYESSFDLLSATLASSSEGMHILTLGPQTNLGEALERDPDLSDQIQGVTIMGGALDAPGNVGPGSQAEWNLYIDPYADAIVFDSDIPITLIPLDATNDVPITPQHKVAFEQNMNTAAVKYIAELFEANPEFAGGGFFFWDPLAAMSLLEDCIGAYGLTEIELEREGRDAGTIHRSTSGSEVLVGLSADAECFGIHLIGTLSNVSHEAIALKAAQVEAIQGNILWQFDMESEETGIFFYSPPSILGNRIYFTGWDGAYYALDRHSGEETWSLAFERYATSYVPIEDSVGYIATTANRLHAVELATGDEKWSYAPDAGIGAPVVKGDLIYVWVGNGELHALDKTSGLKLWEYKTQTEFDADLQYDPGIEFAEGNVYFAGLSRRLAALNAETGEVNWVADTNERLLLDPSIVQNNVCVINPDGQLIAFDLETGKEEWRLDYDLHESGRLIVDEKAGVVMVVASANTLVAVDAQNGKEKWQFTADASIQLHFDNNGLLIDGLLFVRSSDWQRGGGTLYALNTETGEVVWEVPSPSASIGGLAYGEGLLAYGTGDGTVHVVDAANGREIWHFTTSGPAFTTPAIRDNVIYFMSFTGPMYALSRPEQ